MSPGPGSGRDASPPWLRLWDMAVLASVDLWLRLRHRRLVARLRGLMRPLGVRRLHLADPRLANEKFFWRKVMDHDPRFTLASDKIDMRRLVAGLGVEVRMPRVLWTGADAGALPEDLLTEDVVIKAAHGWNQSIIVRDCGQTPGEIRARCTEFLGQSHGRANHEWGYFNVPRRLIVEERLFPGGGIFDIKVKTFGPIVEQLVPIYADTGERTAAPWVPDGRGGWTLFDKPSGASDVIDARPFPAIATEALRIASQIGAAFDHVRVDFLTDGKTLYLGELTLYTGGGIATPFGHQLGSPLNRSWDLRRSWFLVAPQRGVWRLYADCLRRAIDRRAYGDDRLNLPGPLAPEMLDIGLRKRQEGGNAP